MTVSLSIYSILSPFIYVYILSAAKYSASGKLLSPVRRKAIGLLFSRNMPL